MEPGLHLSVLDALLQTRLKLFDTSLAIWPLTMESNMRYSLNSLKGGFYGELVFCSGVSGPKP